MRSNNTFALAAIAVGMATALSVTGGTAQAPPSPDQMVASLKQNLAESQKRLRQYRVDRNHGDQPERRGEVAQAAARLLRRRRQADQGADGGGATGARRGRRRRRRGGGRAKERIVENKVDDMKDYMEKAANLIHLYVPPTAENIQKAKDAGKMMVKPPQQGRVRVEFPDFIQPSDLMAIEVDAKALLLSALSVATYLEKPEDTVTLNVKFGSLSDGTGYTAQTTLDAKAKNIRVVVENSGHRPLAR